MNAKYVIGGKNIRKKLKNSFARYATRSGQKQKVQLLVDFGGNGIYTYIPTYHKDDGNLTLNVYETSDPTWHDDVDFKLRFPEDKPYMDACAMILFLDGKLRFDLSSIISQFDSTDIISGEIITGGKLYKYREDLDVAYERFKLLLINTGVWDIANERVCIFDSDRDINLFMLICALNGDKDVFEKAEYQYYPIL